MKQKFKTFGNVARALRLKHKLTQAQLGYLIGCHSQYISNVERGLCSFPKPEAQAFVRKLNIQPHDRDWLLNALVEDRKRETIEEWRKPLGVK